MLIPAVVAKLTVSPQKVRAHWLYRMTVSTETAGAARLAYHFVDESRKGDDVIKVTVDLTWATNENRPRDPH
jgi:hypothetical protein